MRRTWDLIRISEIKMYLRSGEIEFLILGDFRICPSMRIYWESDYKSPQRDIGTPWRLKSGNFWNPLLMAYSGSFLFLSFMACAKGRILGGSFTSQRKWLSDIYAPLRYYTLTVSDRMSRQNQEAKAVNFWLTYTIIHSCSIFYRIAFQHLDGHIKKPTFLSAGNSNWVQSQISSFCFHSSAIFHLVICGREVWNSIM